MAEGSGGVEGGVYDEQFTGESSKGLVASERQQDEDMGLRLAFPDWPLVRHIAEFRPAKRVDCCLVAWILG